jgi:hypothetical protein
VEINPPIDISDLTSDSPVSFVPMDAVEDGATGRVRLQSRPLGDVQKGYTPFAEGDVLWAKITPCMQNGKSCIARGLQNGIGFGSTEFHVFRVRDSEVSAEFVWEFLSQESLRRVATFAFTGSAGHQRVPDTFLAELPFPKLSPEKQSELVGRMSTARQARLKKLQEADDLLAGLDGFVLDALGLALPADEGRNVYAVRLRDARERIDATYHTPRFRNLQRRLQVLGAVPLGTLCRLSEERSDPTVGDGPTFRYIEISSVNSETGEAQAVKTLRAEAPSRARMLVNEGSIIVSLTRPQRGSIAMIDESLDGCVASTGFAVLTDIDTDVNRGDYLWAYLRTQAARLQMLQRSSGGNYPAITEDELRRVLIPVPDSNIQEQIAAEVARCRENARWLREEAAHIWDEAKRQFEEALLGPEPGGRAS